MKYENFEAAKGICSEIRRQEQNIEFFGKLIETTITPVITIYHEGSTMKIEYDGSSDETIAARSFINDLYQKAKNKIVLLENQLSEL